VRLASEEAIANRVTARKMHDPHCRPTRGMPPGHSEPVMSPARFGLALALGAGVTHFFDPQNGRRRRAEAKDRVTHEMRVVSNALDVAVSDLAHRGQGVIARTREWWLAEAPSDPVLAERIRTRLGRCAVHAHGLDVVPSQGEVELRGDVLEAEVGTVLDVVRGTPGVRSVSDRLLRHTSTDAPQLQRVPRAHRGHPRHRWRPARRLAVGCAGALGVLSGLAVRGPVGTIAFVAGAGAVTRSVTNRRLLDALGLVPGEAAILRKSLLLHAPVERVYTALLDLEKFPRFMRHVLAVREGDSDHYHCKLGGPAGLPLDWDVTVVERVENSRVHFTADSSIAHADGLARFEPRPEEGATRLSLELAYRPVLGAVGRSIGELVGFRPKGEIDDDLMRFKSLVERGRARGRNGVVTFTEVEGSNGGMGESAAPHWAGAPPAPGRAGTRSS
jgi:uncharacterized membrane protein